MVHAGMNAMDFAGKNPQSALAPVIYPYKVSKSKL